MRHKRWLGLSALVGLLLLATSSDSFGQRGGRGGAALGPGGAVAGGSRVGVATGPGGTVAGAARGGAVVSPYGLSRTTGVRGAAVTGHRTTFVGATALHTQGTYVRRSFVHYNC